LVEIVGIDLFDARFIFGNYRWHAMLYLVTKFAPGPLGRVAGEIIGLGCGVGRNVVIVLSIIAHSPGRH